jgi:phosphoribosylamine--glycine ligase
MCARILVLGSGGREHALAWRLSRDPDRPEVVVAPGNEGIARSCRCVPVAETDPAAVVELARRESPALVVVGPEAPLAAGVSDALRGAGFAVSGPSRAAARLESSKWFAKELMREAGVPTPAAAEFGDVASALAALERLGPPWVVKADGLAAGKGVLVTSARAEAEAFVRDCLEGGRFGEGGRRLLLETYVEGEEASVVAICDGERHVLLPAARDHKRAFDGDLGPNTGGMGAFAPTPAVTPELEHAISDRIFTPVLRALHRRGTPYRGALYAGLMLTAAGPRVIEFNARFGDPETQSTLPLLAGSLGLLLESAARGSLEPLACTRMSAAAVTVALVDEGYPENVRGGGVIEGLDEVERADLLVFHAGTRRDGTNWVVRGGRAAYLTAIADTLEAARTNVDAARARLSGHGWRCRTDIAARIPRNAHATGVA